MDLRVLALIADPDLAELVRTQVENLGCRCTVAPSYDEASSSLTWADAAIVDLAGDGVDDLSRLRIEAPTLRVLAIAPDADLRERARSAGVDKVLLEPFSVADIVAGIRSVARHDDASVIDLRTGEAIAAPAVDDAPWWATR